MHTQVDLLANKINITVLKLICKATNLTFLQSIDKNDKSLLTKQLSYNEQPMTDPEDALDLTLRLFKINASKLSEAAGLHKSVISRYRHKRQGLEADTFIEILRALPKDARDFYYSLITEDQDTDAITFVMKEKGGSYKISIPQSLMPV